MPKLLQLNATANWGSTGKIAEGIGFAAMNRGWESAIAYGRYSNPSQSRVIKAANKTDVYLHYARHRLFDSEGLGSKSATRNLIKEIEAFAPDIIHLHNIHDHWLNYPQLFSFLASIPVPVVWTFHDCWAFTGGCGYFDSVNCTKWQSECSHCEQAQLIDRSKRNFNLKKNLLLPLQSRLTLVPVSAWLETFVKQSFLSDCRVEMIHNGIDLSKFKPSESKAVKPLILAVAMPWSARKGLNDMLLLRKEISPDAADMAIVGLDDKQLASLPENIIGIKRTQNIDELVALYSRATVFVNPTHSDNFPTVNLEALACGTPVVTYRTGGSPEAVDGSTGIVVAKGDVGALAEAVNHVICNPAEFTVDACRGRAVRCFDKDVQFGKYIDLYDSLLKQQHNR